MLQLCMYSRTWSISNHKKVLYLLSCSRTLSLYISFSCFTFTFTSCSPFSIIFSYILSHLKAERQAANRYEYESHFFLQFWKLNFIFLHSVPSSSFFLCYFDSNMQTKYICTTTISCPVDKIKARIWVLLKIFLFHFYYITFIVKDSHSSIYLEHPSVQTCLNKIFHIYCQQRSVQLVRNRLIIQKVVGSIPTADVRALLVCDL